MKNEEGKRFETVKNHPYVSSEMGIYTLLRLTFLWKEHKGRGKGRETAVQFTLRGLSFGKRAT